MTTDDPLASDPADPFLVACLDLIGKTGAREAQVRFSDDEHPTIWMVAAEFPTEEEWTWDCAAALHPNIAALRLLHLILDGGTCSFCGRPTAIHEGSDPPKLSQTCLYYYDEKWVRSCSGKQAMYGRDPKTGKIVKRNEPCPCGSGKTFQNCHGNRGNAA